MDEGVDSLGDVPPPVVQVLKLLYKEVEHFLASGAVCNADGVAKEDPDASAQEKEVAEKVVWEQRSQHNGAVIQGGSSCTPPPSST